MRRSTRRTWLLVPGGDTGIDSIGIIVNGSLATDPEIVEEYADLNGFLDVTFVFVQAERSASFETAKIAQFEFGVSDFFKDTPVLQRNAAVTQAAAIMTEVYNRSSKFKRGNPACRLYYMTTGRWTGPRAIWRLDGRRSSLA